MDEYTSMTFAEIAAKLSIKHESARKLVKKNGWHRKRANDGRVLVDVPNDYDWSRPQRNVEPPKEAAPLDAPMPDEPGSKEERDPKWHAVEVELRLTMARLETRIEGLNDLVAAERLRADAEARRADDANGRVTAVERECDEWRDRWIAETRRPWWKRLAG